MTTMIRHVARCGLAGAVLVWLPACTTPKDGGEGRAQAEPVVGQERPTAEFRVHHAEIREHLGHIDSMAWSLAGQSPVDQRQTMQKVVTFLKGHMAPHAADEERVVYPAVERHAGPGARLTGAPIYEHRVVERSIATLEAQAARENPDAAAFAREALHLTGLLYAHFEVEEEVLLPVLDRTMSAEQFKREVSQKLRE